MAPYDHARLSARDFGGIPEDYEPIHRLLDSTKFFLPDFSHRAILHNTFGMYLCEQVFGGTITNSDGKKIDTKEIARRHILEDCSRVPSMEETLKAISENSYHQFNKPRKKDLEWLRKN